MAISEKAKEEMRELAASASLRDDMRHVAMHRHNPIMVDGKVDGDRLIEFLTGYNEFINHEPKPFKPIKDTMMKL